MNSQTHLIKKALLSEKTHGQMENGIYTFLVDRSATKYQIARAIEKQFEVDVERVNVLKKTGKTKRIGRTRKYTKTRSGKKAIVVLKKGQNIALFSTKVEKGKTKKVEKQKDWETPSADKTREKKGKGLLGRFRQLKQKENQKEEK